MKNQKIMFSGVIVLLAMAGVCAWLYGTQYTRLSSQVARLNLERRGYVLGVPLSKEQIQAALENLIEAPIPGTYKFKDKNLFVVARESDHRVLVMYERFEKASQSQVQDVIGDLYMNFEDPTVSAHEKVVYWAYSKTGKISADAFDKAKKDKKKLEILATIKCVSDIRFMGESQASTQGQVYYIISSDPMLQRYKDKQKSISS